METFVHEEWVKEIDFESCETLDKSFVSDHYKQTESDLIYKVRLKNRKKEIFIFILIEFQSTVDHWMALRMLNYITNFYMDYIQTHKQAKILPPVFPLMLYNGDAQWKAPVKLQDLIESDVNLSRFGIRFEYFKLAENEFTKENLLKIKNIVSTLFLAESHYNIEMLFNELITVFDKESDKQAVSLLINWFRQMKENHRIDPKDYKNLEDTYKDHQEVKSMLVTAIEKEKEVWKLEGKMEDAKIMLKEGLTIESISKFTGLSKEQIQKLKDN